MTATYIHTRKKLGLAQLVLRILAALYFLGLAAAIVYLWLFTQDRFITSASFRISRQDATVSDLGLAQMVLPGLADSGSIDSQNAIAFVASSDLLLEIEKEFDLRNHYASPKYDYFFKLAKDASVEDRLEYYRSRISARYDSVSGMTILSIDTFSPELSAKIAQSLLKRAENFVNVINQHVADQQLHFIQSEVERSSKNVADINDQMLKLQNAHNLISPEQEITANLNTVQDLRLSRIKLEADAAAIIRNSPESPRLESLRSRMAALDETIRTENEKLSGPEQDRLNQLLSQFNQLKIKLEFATNLRTGAEAMLEKIRVEAVSRSRFFSVIQNPYLPEEVAIPRRPYTTITILCLGILGFFVLRALAHSVFERA